MANQANQDSPPKKRRFRAGNETLRQRTQRTQAQPSDAKPRAGQVFLRGFSAPLRALGRQLQKLGRFKALRIVGRILLPRYLRNAGRELRLVTWPNAKESRQLTFAVVIFAVIFGVLIAGVDYGLDKLFKGILLK